MRSFHIIGCGKVAQTLAVRWQQSGRLALQGAWNRHLTTARQLVARVGSGCAYAEISALPAADIVVVGVKDDAIAGVASSLAALPWLSSQSTVLHFSGALSSQILADAIPQKIQTGSLHPVFAFADIEQSIAALGGHMCAIEGGPAALPVLQALAAAAGLYAFNIAASAKKRYHAGLSAAANFLVTLHAYAQAVLAAAGLPETTAKALVQQLMQQNLDQLAAIPASQALTGPIVRGDAHTVAQHLSALEAQEQALYIALAQHTILLAQPRLSKKDATVLLNLLRNAVPEH